MLFLVDESVFSVFFVFFLRRFQARSKLSLIQENQKEFTKTIEQYNGALRDLTGANNMADTSHLFSEKENGTFRGVAVSILLHVARLSILLEAHNVIRFYLSPTSG